MGWEIQTTYIDDWLSSIDEETFALIHAALDVLAREGPSLGRPLIDTIAHSRFKNLKELRPGSGGSSEIRILFAFDPNRQAILLIAGDKSTNWKKWYRHNVAAAEDIFEHDLKTQLGEFDQ